MQMPLSGAGKTRPAASWRIAAFISATALLSSAKTQATNFSISVDTADRTLHADGTMDWVGQNSSRVGKGSASTSQTVCVLPFQLPTIPSGEQVQSATLDFNVQGWNNWGDPLTNLDLYGITITSSSSAVTS